MTVPAVAAGSYAYGVTYPQRGAAPTPAAQPQPAATDPDGDGDRDTPGRIDARV